MSLEHFKLEDMIKGWFIGSFEPTLFTTENFEVGIKQYTAGDTEAEHYHKIATEFTVILNGSVEMDGKQYRHGDIVKVKPGVATNFIALSNVTTVVVKVPCAINDKYLK